MSGLVLRASWSEGVLRSVGDPPNGTVGIASPSGEPTLTIDRHHQPGQSRLEITETGINPEHSTPIGLAEAVEACESGDALIMLSDLVNNTVGAGLRYLIANAAYDEARRFVDLAERTYIQTRQAWVDRAGEQPGGEG